MNYENNYIFLQVKLYLKLLYEMKKLTILVALTCLAMTIEAQGYETATQAVANMGVGWNLGNTLDATNGKQQGLGSETYWGQPKTKPELMVMLKEAGFGAVRVPVTWYNHMDSNGKVDAEWMHRVHEVVDYVLHAGMYCLVNVHHDTGDGSQWLHASSNCYNQVRTKYEYLWQQIANEFKDYDHKLLFESYNEMLDDYNSWCFASFAAPGNYNATSASDSYTAINNYAQSFVTTVRNTGGNNAKRNLVVNTYAAANGYGGWNSHLKDPLIQMKMPNDPAGEGHIAFQVHFYPSVNNINSAKSEVDGMISLLKANLVSKGGPVIVGEWGTANANNEMDYDVRRQNVLTFADYFVKKAKQNGLATFLWMGLTDGDYRSIPAFSQPDLAQIIVEAYHGSSNQYVFPTIEDRGSVICFEGEKSLAWGGGDNWEHGIKISNSMFAAIGNTVQMELTYTITGNNDDIQLYYGDWSSKPSFIVDGKTYSGDFNPRNVLGVPAGTTCTSVFTFSRSVYELLTQKGLIIHGDAVTITKAILTKSSANGISTVEMERNQGNSSYDLQGRQVQYPTHGIYIRKGRKVMIK